LADVMYAVYSVMYSIDRRLAAVHDRNQHMYY